MSDASTNIEALLSEERVFEPPAGFRERAVVDDPAIYERADADLEAFWAEQAERLYLVPPLGHRDGLDRPRGSGGSTAAS